MSNETDPRKDIILGTAERFLGLTIATDDKKSLQEDLAVSNFLNDINCMLLSCSKKENSIYCTNQIMFTPDVNNALLFFKIKNEPIKAESLHQNIFISSMIKSPLRSIYYYILRIYKPMLSNDSFVSDINIDPKLQNILKELENRLRTILLNQSKSEAASFDKDSSGDILTLLDEVNFWKESGDKHCLAFSDLLEPLAVKYLNLSENLDFTSIEDLLDYTFVVLDEIWKKNNPMFPEARMENIMEIIGNDLVAVVQQKFKNFDFWRDDLKMTDEPLRNAISVCEKWIQYSKDLTTLYWPNYDSHRWSHKHFTPDYLGGFSNRLKQVHTVLAIYYKFKALFDEEERKKFSLNTFFSSFKALNALQYNEYTEPLWKDAVASYDTRLAVLDREAALRLKSIYQNIGSNTLQLLQVFQNYEELLVRPLIQNMMLPERQSLLEQLTYYISTMNPRGDNDIVMTMDMPQSVASLIKARQDEEKINFILNGERVLSDLNGYSDFVRVAEETRDELRQYQNEQFSDWISETSAMLRMKGVGLRTDDVVVHFKEGKLMSVNFSKHLVNLIRETRQLKSLGYPVDADIIDAAEKAQNCITYAKELNKIATFHNTIGDHIIRSQKGMMLKTARELARLVQSQHVVTWKNLKAVEDYINKLRNVVQKLAKENHKLGLHHYYIMKKLSQLVEFDLYNQTSIWRKELRTIKEIIQEIEKEFSNSLTWRNHIDWQIYKVMECQYRSSLQNSKDFLNELNIELHISENMIKCRPSIPQLKKEFLHQLKTSLLFPRTMSYFGDDNIYESMIEFNASRVDKVFLQGSLMFDKLQNFIKSLYDWASIATINIDSFIEKHITKSADWEHNLKTSKFLAQELAKFSRSPIKIECFLISMDRLWDDLETENSKCWKKLITCLRATILTKIMTLESFVREALSIVNQVPVSVEEYVEIHYNHQKMLDENKKTSLLLLEIEEYHLILKTWTGEVMSQTEDIKALWFNYQLTLTSFNNVFIKKAETLREKLLESINNLIDEVNIFEAKWNEMKPKNEHLLSENSVEVENLISVTTNLKEEWSHLMERIIKLKNDCKKFNMDEPEFQKIELLEEEIHFHEATWAVLQDFRKDVKNLADQEWALLKKTVYKKIESFVTSWEGKVQVQASSIVVARIQQGLEQFKRVIPYLKFFLGETFTEKHWHEVFNLFGRSYKPIHEITFGDLLFSVDEIEDKINELKEINNRAAAEVVIRQALSELDIWEIEAKFSTTLHVDSTGNSMTLIKDFKGVMNKIGDNQNLLQSIGSAAGTAQFVDRISLWEKKLSEIDQQLRNLSQVQQKWVYLEPILNKSLLEQVRFGHISKEFRHLLSNLSKHDFKVIAMVRVNNMGSILSNLLTQLELCEKSLLNFLEEKRLRFPRFYFISDCDLLEMLGQPNKIDVLQSHLKKVFTGIHSVIFNDNGDITGITSSQGELVNLRKTIVVSDNIEVWLEALGAEMKLSLKVLLLECLDQPDPVKYPSQILCLTEQISFTKRCEDAIRSKTLKNFLNEIMKKYHQYTAHMVALRRGKSSNASKLLNIKLKALLMDSIYFLRIVNSLIEKNVVSVKDWNWEKCIRFYLNEHREVVIQIADASFDYSYEYQGNQAKLVHTTLTDKCYLSLTQALHMGFGGNPYGPAGTGKTESVKSLGSLLGRQVLVFNCDEGLDVLSLTRIMMGIVKCGAWGCFDEFNRLEEKTLSLISLHISDIQNALKSKLITITLLNKQVEVNLNAGIFITLNPAGKGYGGRQKLPESLKTLFRPVVMTKPDDIDIATVILHCEGYKTAAKIALKLVTLFEMAKDILPCQGHYDWGLRALKTVVSGCGHFLNEYLKENEAASEESEFKLVVQAVQLNTLCKLTYRDGQQFSQLIADVFPGVELSSAANYALKQCLKEAFNDLNLIYSERQVQKCLELFELLKQRMGVVIVGPASSGKTTIISLLKKVLIMQGATIRYDILNPKSISRSELLGYIDLDTRQWNDGILTSIAQKVYNEPVDVTCWLHCDGDVDPEWIESLNSVLDDNHLLTLPSGWRIHFGDNVHFIFETHELVHASPATISRMGIVLLSEEDLKVEMLIDAWLENQSAESPFSEFLADSIHRALCWIQENGKFSVHIPFISTVRSCLSLLHNITSKPALAVSLINGFGSNLDDESKASFCSFVFNLVGEVSLNQPNESLYYFYDDELDRIGAYGLDGDTTFQSRELVPIPFIKVAMDIITFWLTHQEPVVIVGRGGSGKRSLIKDCLRNLYNTELIIVECNPQLSSSHIIDIFHEVCVLMTSNARRVYKPRNTERIIIHFSHINLLYMDKWGSRMLIEFLKQTTFERGFYDKNLEWVGLENVNFIYTTTSLDEISARFIASNHILHIRSPVTTEMDHIYSSFIKNLYPSLEKPFQISELMVSIYHDVQSVFCGSMSDFSFNPKDLSKWCKNFNRYGTLNKEKFSEAFLNESRRLFKDKLTSPEESSEFEKIIKTKLDQTNSGIKYTALEGVFYICDNPGERKSSLIKTNLQEWQNIIQKSLFDYDSDLEYGPPILTPDILKLMAKLECILTESGGCVLLGGKVGIGRKTALKVIAKRNSASIYAPKIGEQYTQKHFKNDLKNAMHLAGVAGEHCYFFLEDYQLKESYILNMLNCVISSGEVPGLYSAEEFNSIILSLKAIASENNYEGLLSQYFKDCICSNFHLVISFDTDNKGFIQQFKGNPVLQNCCYLIKTRLFSENAMSVIPTELLLRHTKSKELLDQEKRIVNALAGIHKRVETIKSVSPFLFFVFIKTYIKMNKIKESTLESRQKQLQAGISKITEAQNVVEELKTEAHEQESRLQEKQAKSNAVLDQISLTMANASLKKSEMEELRRKTEEENQTLQVRKQEIDKELAEIEPILHEARAAVGNIKPESITEIRSLRAPTTIIRDILEAVLRLMGIHDTSWNSMKTFLSQRGVRDEIRFFDASQITKEDRDAVDNILHTKKDSFLPVNAKRASLAAAPLAAWVTANVQYSLVLEKIRPLTREQNKLEKTIQDADMKIEELGTGLKSVDDIVSKLQEHLKISTKEGAEIEIHLRDAQKRIIAAEDLVKRLSDEFTIWVKEHTEITDALSELWKMCIIAAGFITYLSDTSENLRRSILEDWKVALGVNKDFSCNSFLSSDHELITLSHEGLPSDEFTLQNGLITLNSIVPPLLLDPLSVAASWLKNHFKDENLSIISHHNANFLSSLELSIRFGKTVILEISSSIPCLVMPILQQSFIYQGTRKMIYVGDKLIDFNQNFRLFLLAHDFQNDDFSEMILPCPILNFKTSKVGLSEQLLDCALHVEKPTLEQQRLLFIEEEEGLKLKLYQMQEDLLQKLARAQGDILQNQELLKSLEITKESSNGIRRTLNESSLLKENLNKERDLYRPLADYGSNLCFACMRLNLLNELYQISIDSFKKLFETSLHNNQVVDSMEMKCKNLLNLVYDYMSRSLLKNDVLTFALHLTHEMCPQLFKNNEWEVFIGKLVGETSKNNLFSEDDIPTWIEADRVPHLLYLQNSLPELFQKLNLKTDHYWLDFVNSVDPSPPNNMNLSTFQFILIIQALRPDRLYNRAVEFALQSLGLKYIHPSSLKLNKLYLETVASEAILIISSPGNDPSRDILALAVANKIQNVHEFAAGPGCEDEIVKLLQFVSSKGHWIILKNLHLIAYWLPVFEKELRSLNPDDKFRLWLTTEPCKHFSSGFLNICLKITYEAPPGIKRNMERIYDNWISQDHLEVNEIASKVMFVLAWIHVILQERRTYIPQGWTSYYEFNDADLECGRATINRLFSKTFSYGINWSYLQGLFEIAIYGGRINNIYDLRVLSTYLHSFFKKDIVENPNFEVASNIRIPKSINMKEHLSIIKSLPETDNPDFFGLPKNVNRIWQREACLSTINKLKALDKDNYEEETVSFEEQYSSLFPVIDHWKKLTLGKNLLCNITLITEESSPMALFFSSEMLFGVALVTCINESLLQLEERLKEGQFTEETSKLALQLKSQQIPDKWEKIWSGPNNPLLYLQSVIARAESICYLYDKWMDENNVFDLAQLFNVHRFLAALKQQAARFFNISIEYLHLSATIGFSSASIMEGSIIITGLLVEGATISYNQLTENLAESSSISVVPNILLSWNKEEKNLKELSAVSIPLYLTDRRDKVVADLLIPCEAYEKEKWILAGTAFYIRS